MAVTTVDRSNGNASVRLSSPNQATSRRLSSSTMLGIVETIVPGSLTGMYGGMLFAMRDSMAAGSRTMTAALAVGAIFGIVVTVAMKFYNHALRGTVMEAGD
jgi:hypothetical protein